MADLVILGLTTRLCVHSVYLKEFLPAGERKTPSFQSNRLVSQMLFSKVFSWL